MNVDPMHVRAFGPTALLAEVDDAAAALALATWLREQGVAATEVVPAARTVLLDGLDPADLGGARALLAGWRDEPTARDDAGQGSGPVAPVVELPVVYDGPDLDDVADLWGVSREEVVARHTGLELLSVFCGFAPGFAYLSGLPQEWAVPRLDSPRTRVPAGSVAVADTWCGVYPTASPGGWRLLGRTRTPLWDVDRDPPALLAPGTRVRFVVEGPS